MFHLVTLVFFSYMVKNGQGQHAIYLAHPEEQLLQIAKWQMAFQIGIIMCTLLTKISISLMILRIKDTKALRYILLTMMFFITGATIAMIITELVSCIPLKALWTPSIGGKCIAPAKVYDVAYVQSGVTIVTDLCLTISPIVILWNVKINKKRKILICVLMSLGLVATICNALRSAFEQRLLVSDPSYASTPVTIVCIMEMGSGIIAACIPACMPLLKTLKTGNKGPLYTYSESRESRKQTKQSSSKLSGPASWGASADDEADLISLERVHMGSKGLAV